MAASREISSMKALMRKNDNRILDNFIVVYPEL